MLTQKDINSDILELKFSGNGISPYKMSNKEMADMLIAMEDCIMPIVMRENPEIEFDRDGLINFVEIGFESVSIRSRMVQYVNKIKDGLLILTLSLNTSNFSDLPAKSRAALNRISKFSSDYSCTANIGYSKNDFFNPLAEIKKTRSKRTSYFKQYTEVIGRLIKIDVENLEAIIRGVNGIAIKFDISDSDVIEYRDWLKEEVKLSGTAKVNGSSFNIAGFEKAKLEPYKFLSIRKTEEIFKNLEN